jgi:XRE family transcriptional regulator, regulator of sulfur utilization
MLQSMLEPKKPRPGRPKGARTFDPAPALAFGEAVRERRFELGLSQEQLGNTAQIERSHMGKIERGEHLPNLILILRLAKALSVKPGLLVDKAADALLNIDKLNN